MIKFFKNKNRKREQEIDENTITEFPYCFYSVEAIWKRYNIPMKVQLKISEPTDNKLNFKQINEFLKDLLTDIVNERRCDDDNSLFKQTYDDAKDCESESYKS